MAITHSYVDYGAGNDTTGDGTIGTPWKTLQKAFDTLTRNTTDGNQVNLKAGTAHVNSASLDLATFIGGGALSSAAPLIVRGYTSAANDGGQAEIDCGGATMWAANTYDYVYLIDLEIHTFGDNDGIYLDANFSIENCAIHKGASSPSNKALIRGGFSGAVIGCHIYNAGTGTVYHIRNINYAIGNFVDVATGHTGGYAITASQAAIGNIVRIAGTGDSGIWIANLAIGNIIYSTVAATGNGILATGNTPLALNNIVVGYSGTGGDGIETANTIATGYNAFYNCTTNTNITDQNFNDMTASDVSLGADPFTDAANGDFSLTTAGAAALRSLGWPTSYLGTAAGTDPHVTIGAIQMGPTPAAGGGLAYPVVGAGIIRGVKL